MLGIICGLGSALLWGVGDFLARFASQSVGVFRAYFYGQLAGFILLSLVIGLWPLPTLTGPLTGLIAGLAIVNTAAALLLYRALAIGTLAIVSPIISSGNTLAVVLGLLSGEQPTTAKLIGIGLTAIGVPLASTVLDDLRGRPLIGRGVLEAVLAALGFGISLWSVQFAIQVAGAIWTTWGLRIFSLLLLVGVAALARRSLTPPSTSGWAWVLPVGLLDVGAYLAYNIGLTGDFVAIVAVLSSLFSAVTVLLAWVILHERLALNQWAGVGLLLVGVVLVSLPNLG